MLTPPYFLSSSFFACSSHPLLHRNHGCRGRFRLRDQSHSLVRPRGARIGPRGPRQRINNQGQPEYWSVPSVPQHRVGEWIRSYLREQAQLCRRESFWLFPHLVPSRRVPQSHFSSLPPSVPSSQTSLATYTRSISSAGVNITSDSQGGSLYWLGPLANDDWWKNTVIADVAKIAKGEFVGRVPGTGEKTAKLGERVRLVKAAGL